LSSEAKTSSMSTASTATQAKTDADTAAAAAAVTGESVAAKKDGKMTKVQRSKAEKQRRKRYVGGASDLVSFLLCFCVSS
jgi:hypothetical protein